MMARPAQIAAFVALAACGGGPGVPSPPPSPPPSTVEAAPTASAKPGLAGLQVYDESGTPTSCLPPKDGCPESVPKTAFLDRCRLAGFQVRQCGCESRCSGDVAGKARYYDENGEPRECAPARADCTPRQAKAAFQDECTERGFRLEVCGCAWLCSGKFLR